MPDLTPAAGLPSWHPPLPVLELAELVLTGALAALPAGLESPAGPVMIEDAEGTPVAVIDAAARSVRPLQPFAHGPLRGSRQTPAQVRALLGERAGGRSPAPVLAVPVTKPLSPGDVDSIIAKAAAGGQLLLWLALIGSTAHTPVLAPAPLLRAVQAISEQAAATGTPSLAVPVAVPLGAVTATTDAELIDEVARAYGGTELCPARDSGVSEPGDVHPAFARELDLMLHPPRYPGATIFFTGLSGSGKSTVAKALTERLSSGDADFPGRTVSLLDGDEVRRMLSSGLGFSRADRDLNILRIGYVAAEVARHGGLAVCAPIAPFDVTRQQVREQTEATGGRFLLVHVNTPLAECERRDRKGLYAKARAGQIAEFTGISSPYEDPADADLRLDTSLIPVDDAVRQVWELLRRFGLLSRS